MAHTLTLRTLALTAAACLITATASAQSAGTLTDLNQGDRRYRWSRGPLAIELHDRDARWSAAEARLMADAFDVMPDVFLRKATGKGNIERVYRDVLPRSPKGAKARGAVCVAYKGYIGIGDSVLVQRPDRVLEVMLHELAHAVHYGVFGNQVLYTFLNAPRWTRISWTSAVTKGLRSWNGFVSDYARTNDHEDFAESAEFYWLAPDELLRVSPAKFAYMRDVVFEGQMSPTAVRHPNKRAIAPVGPEIDRLGDTVDDPGSVVQVRGKHFMGFKDGGFNTVRYGGKRALHLPVSRSRIVSWVPSLSPGAAPITVTTQDGPSAPKAFTVKKSWWKFW